MKLIREPATRIWLLLVLATIATTWWLSKDAFPERAGTIAILCIAALKVRWVLLHFMELREAPRILRGLFEAWVVLVTAAILFVYLRTPLAG